MKLVIGHAHDVETYVSRHGLSFREYVAIMPDDPWKLMGLDLLAYECVIVNNPESRASDWQVIFGQLQKYHVPISYA